MNMYCLKINNFRLFHNFSHFSSLHTLGTYLYFSSLKALQIWLRRKRIRQAHRPEFIEGFRRALNVISKMKCKEKDKTHFSLQVKRASCLFYGFALYG